MVKKKLKKKNEILTKETTFICLLNIHELKTIVTRSFIPCLIGLVMSACKRKSNLVVIKYMSARKVNRCLLSFHFHLTAEITAGIEKGMNKEAVGRKHAHTHI